MKRLVIALVLCLAGTMVSGLLLLQHHGEGGAVAAVNQVCGEGEGGTASGCETVAASPWSSVAGFPVAGIGLVFYGSLTLLLALALLLPEDQRSWMAGLAIGGLVLGLLVDVLLLGVQTLAIQAFCTLCILTYALSAGALFALLPAWRDALGAGAALGRTEGRLALAGWAFGTLALIVAVAAAEVALDARQQGRQRALLGDVSSVPTTPEAEAPPAPETTPDEGEPSLDGGQAASEAEEHRGPFTGASQAGDGHDAAYWEQRAEELQQTLDDPEKLQQYFAKKAEAEFESAPVEPIEMEGVPRKGPADAPVKVVEYSDFLCPFCRNLAGAPC